MSWDVNYEKEKQMDAEKRRKQHEEILKKEASLPIWEAREREGERIEASFRRTQDELARIKRMMDEAH